MAEAQFIKNGDLAETFGKVSQRTPMVAERMLLTGSAILADEVRRRLNVLFPDASYRLPSAFGVTPVGGKDGNYNIKIGFGGYQDTVTYKNGMTYNLKRPVAYQLIARVVENGTKKRVIGAIKARPFFATSVRAKRSEMEQAMQKAAETAFNEIIGGIR